MHDPMSGRNDRIREKKRTESLLERGWIVRVAIANVQLGLDAVTGPSSQLLRRHLANSRLLPNVPVCKGRGHLATGAQREKRAQGEEVRKERVQQPRYPNHASWFVLWPPEHLHPCWKRNSRYNASQQLETVLLPGFVLDAHDKPTTADLKPGGTYTCGRSETIEWL
jgi:hypothetical protein